MEGDYYKKLIFCDHNELETDIWGEILQFNWKELVEAHDIRKNEISEIWIGKRRKLKKSLEVSNL